MVIILNTSILFYYTQRTKHVVPVDPPSKKSFTSEAKDKSSKKLAIVGHQSWACANKRLGVPAWGETW